LPHADEKGSALRSVQTPKTAGGGGGGGTLSASIFEYIADISAEIKERRVFVLNRKIVQIIRQAFV
jgi:hypothetical protein